MKILYHISNNFGLILIIVQCSVHILGSPWKKIKILTYVKVQQTPNPAAQFPSTVPPTKQRKELNLQLWTLGYIQLLNKPYKNENEVTLRGQKISLKCCQLAELLMYIERGV